MSITICNSQKQLPSDYSMEFRKNMFKLYQENQFCFSFFAETDEDG